MTYLGTRDKDLRQTTHILLPLPILLFIIILVIIIIIIVINIVVVVVVVVVVVIAVDVVSSDTAIICATGQGRTGSSAIGLHESETDMHRMQGRS